MLVSQYSSGEPEPPVTLPPELERAGSGTAASGTVLQPDAIDAATRQEACTMLMVNCHSGSTSTISQTVPSAASKPSSAAGLSDSRQPDQTEPSGPTRERVAPRSREHSTGSDDRHAIHATAPAARVWSSRGRGASSTMVRQPLSETRAHVCRKDRSRLDIGLAYHRIREVTARRRRSVHMRRSSAMPEVVPSTPGHSA
jgi:hypothetical protein